MSPRTPKPKAPGSLGKRPGKRPGRPLNDPHESADILEERELFFPQAIQGVNRIRVQRLDDYSKKMTLHGYLAPDEQTEIRIAELWGGGRYSVSLMAPDERGSQVVRDRKEVSVLGAYRRPGEIYGMQQSTPTTPGVSPVQVAGVVMPQGISTNEALDQIRLQQVLDVVKQSRETVARTSDVPWDRIFDVGMKALELFTRRPDPTADLRAELERMREDIRRQPVQGPVTTGIADITKAIEQLLSVRDTIREGAGDREDSSMTSLLGDVVKMLANQQRGPGAPVPPSRIPGKIEVQPVVPAPSPSGPVLPMWQQMLKHYGPQLIGAAQSGKDPGFIAEVAFQFMPADMAGVALEFVKRPDAAAVAMQELPVLREFESWNAEFWVEFRKAMLGEEDADSGTTANEEG